MVGVAATAVIGFSGLNTVVFVMVSAVMLIGARSAVVFALVLAVSASVVPQFIGPWHLNGVQWGQAAQVILSGDPILYPYVANPDILVVMS